MFVKIVMFVNKIFWDDLIKIPVGNKNYINISFLALLLISIGMYFSFRTKFLPLRFFKDIIDHVNKNLKIKRQNSLSGIQTLIVSTASRVGMGNLLGVAAAVSAGGAGAIFWMWLTALIGSSTAFIEAVLAQLYKKNDPLYGGYKGGPAYYIHDFFASKSKTAPSKKNLVSSLFALSGLICWCGISQVVGNSVSSTFENAFNIPVLYSAILLLVIASIVVLRRNLTVRVLDLIVPIMSAGYLLITIVVMLINIKRLPDVINNILSQAFGLRQVVAGGIGAAITNGVKRGLFSNESGSGSAPCAAAAAETKNPIEIGFLQVFGVLVDTIVCTCTAIFLLLTPQKKILNLSGMELLQASMKHHLGSFGAILIALTLLFFSFSTFLGILFYARSNISYLFGDNWPSQNLFKIIALIMLFIGAINKYDIVWILADVGIALMTMFNIVMLLPMSKEVLKLLNDYSLQTKKRTSK